MERQTLAKSLLRSFRVLLTEERRFDDVSVTSWDPCIQIWAYEEKNVSKIESLAITCLQTSTSGILCNRYFFIVLILTLSSFECCKEME